MKAFFPLFVVILCSRLLAIEGIIDETNNAWGPEGNVKPPIVLQGAIIVPEGITLAIGPGTVVEGSASINIVRGSIIADGTKDSTITLSQEIIVQNSHTAYFEHVIFNNAQILIDTSTNFGMKHCILKGGANALTLDSCTFAVENSIFYGASQASIKVVNSRGGVKNVTSYGTSVAHITLVGETNVIIYNSILVGGAYGVWSTAPACSAIVIYSLVNSLVSTYGDPGIIAAGDNVIEGINPQFADTTKRDFHLKGTSPAIDAGNPQDDYSNEPDGGGGRINMGAYGNTDEAVIKVVDVSERPLNPCMKNLWMSATPNPFNLSTTIEFASLNADIINFGIYNSKGVLIQSHSKIFSKPGAYQLIWDGRTADGKEIPQGIYIVRLFLKNGKTLSKKLIFIK